MTWIETCRMITITRIKTMEMEEREKTEMS